MLKRIVRRLVVQSSRPPLVGAYRGLYAAAIRMAVLALKRHRGIAALYLGRGCAKNEISPGISDIDFTVIAEDDDQALDSIRKTCRALKAASGGLIEYFPNLVMTERTLENRWLTSPAWQSRLHEGRTTYRLLYGRDPLASLPALSEVQLKAATFAEMNQWWLRFAYSLLLRQEYDRDAIGRNSVCYKAVSELLNARRALETGEREYSRARGLANCEMPLARRLERVAAGRFLTPDQTIADETYRFMLEYFAELWDLFLREPFLTVHAEIGQRADCPASEMATTSEVERRVDSLRRHVEKNWEASFNAIHLAKSAFWDFDDTLLIVDSKKDGPPTVRQLADLVALYNKTSPVGRQRLYLFLRIGSICFPLTPEVPADYHRGLLTPATVPDVFLQLGPGEVYWTDYARWYLTDWKSNERWPDPCAQKRSQLEIIADTEKRGLVVYPLTPGAIARTKSG